MFCTFFTFRDRTSSSFVEILFVIDFVGSHSFYLKFYFGKEKEWPGDFAQ